MRFLPAACFLPLFCTSMPGYSQSYDGFPDARPAIRALYHPPATPDQYKTGLENPIYYPFRLYWDSRRCKLSCLKPLLPEAGSDDEMAAVCVPSWGPEYAVVIRGNTLYWGMAAGGLPLKNSFGRPFLFPEWMHPIVNRHIGFPDAPFPSWCRPYAEKQSYRLREEIETLHTNFYSRNYVCRGTAGLPPALAQELKITWKECLETAILDLPTELWEHCDQGRCCYSTVPGLFAEELSSFRGCLPLKRHMFHIFRVLIDAASMNDLTPKTQGMLMELCADARNIAADMKKSPPRGIRRNKLHTHFHTPYPENGKDLWEGKEAPPRSGKSLAADVWKECSALPLSTNPVWKDLFPNAPEHVTAWMNVHAERYFGTYCGGAFIHEGFLHIAITRLGIPFYRMHDFSRMKHPPAMSPYELWWDGDDMRVQRFFLKLEPAAERELKTCIRLLSQFRAGENRTANNPEEPFHCMLFSTDLGHEDRRFQDPDSCPPGLPSMLKYVYPFWTTGDTDYLQEGSRQLAELRRDRRKLEKYLIKHPPATETASTPAMDRGAQKP